ncbi:MAG TPA: DUF1330 domain-containing protein [Pseudolabrys sp.]|nr:DUF1330 domain-containing protein [Pseudolabrys sp.]
MPAYVISEVKFLDRELVDRYRPLAAASIERYGGKYVVRGGPVDCVEGTRDPDRAFVVVEFPDMARAKEWYASPDYAEALKVRRAGALERTLVFVEGV